MITLALSFMLCFSHAAEFSSEVAAQIGKKEVVTSRRVEAAILLENFWDHDMSTYTPVPVHSGKFSSELERFLIQRIVFLESRSFSFAQLSEKEVDATKNPILKRIKKNPQASKEWRELELSTKEVDDLVKQKMAAEKFVEFKTKSALVPVTDAEALNYYHNNKKDYGNKAYKAIKEDIKKNLAQDQAQQRLDDWYDILRKKYEVTKVISIN